MAIVYCCSVCGYEVDSAGLVEGQAMACPDHPEAVIESVVTPGEPGEPAVPRAWFPPGSLGDAQHQVACWAVLDPEDSTSVEDYRPR